MANTFLVTPNEQLIFDHDLREPPEGPTFDELADAVFGPDGPVGVSVTTAARMLGIGRTMAYEAVKDGSLPSFKIRRRILIPVHWLVEARNGRAWIE